MHSVLARKPLKYVLGCKDKATYLHVERLELLKAGSEFGRHPRAHGRFRHPSRVRRGFGSI